MTPHGAAEAVWAHRAIAFRQAKRLGFYADEAEDIVLEVVMRAMRHAQKIDPDRVGGWVAVASRRTDAPRCAVGFLMILGAWIGASIVLALLWALAGARCAQ